MANNRSKCKRKKRKKKAAKKAATKRILLMTASIRQIHEDLDADGRCKHGLTKETCAYCQGQPVSTYSSSVGLAFIHRC